MLPLILWKLYNLKVELFGGSFKWILRDTFPHPPKSFEFVQICMPPSLPRECVEVRGQPSNFLETRSFFHLCLPPSCCLGLGLLICTMPSFSCVLAIQTQALKLALGNGSLLELCPSPSLASCERYRLEL